MTKVAIYARYSSDNQREASIEDQIRICTERAKREQWDILNTYTDYAVSGASMIRPGIQQLMQDAPSGQFDFVIAESLDRLSRDQEDIAGIYKRLSFSGVRILTLSEGEISELHIGLKGTMGALFLKDLADKTRRGLRGRVEAGKSGGGITYGYDIINQLQADGTPLRGEREINETEAEIVRRIFREYALGKSPRAIAQQLNKEAVPGPSGKGWGPSTIHGNRRRGTGILNNELYVGRLVWNRLRYMKDPDTGRRVSRLNPEEEWIIRDVPELRIIDQDLWDAVKAKQGEIRAQNTSLCRTNRPRYLFSHLIKCGCCGGGYSMISASRLGCSSARNKGNCTNRLTMPREKLESAVLDALQTHLMDEKLCSEFCAEYTKHMNQQRIDHNASLAGYRKELAKLERERQKIVKSVLDGVPGSVLKDRATYVEKRKTELEDILERVEEAPVLFHPNMAQRYHQEVQRLIQILNDEKNREEAVEIVRSLVDQIVLSPSLCGKRLLVDLKGDLAGILTVATNGDSRLISDAIPWITDNRQDVLVAGVRNTADLPESEKQAALVAGVGFEPTTFRL